MFTEEFVVKIIVCLRELAHAAVQMWKAAGLAAQLWLAWLKWPWLEPTLREFLRARNVQMMYL